jgi:hypothetical protein
MATTGDMDNGARNVSVLLVDGLGISVLLVDALIPFLMTGNVQGIHKQHSPRHQGMTLSFNEEKNLARLAWEQSSCDLRTDLKSDVRAYVCMSSIHEWTHTSHA